MQKFAIAAGVAALLMATAASAHHKPGHHIPPGLAKRLPTWTVEAPPQRPVAIATLGVEVGWQRFRDVDFDFEIDLPLGLFDVGDDEGRLTLYQRGGLGQLDVYGASNLQRLSPIEFVAAIEEAGHIDEITYRAGGESWFVLSGYMTASDSGERLIFYAKFMFSADRSRVSAFEMSYPAADREWLDPVVEHLEDSLTAPY